MGGFVGVLAVGAAIVVGVFCGRGLRKLFKVESPDPIDDLKYHARFAASYVNVGTSGSQNSTFLCRLEPFDLGRATQAMQRYRASCPFIQSVSRHTVIYEGTPTDCLVIKLHDNTDAGKSAGFWQAMYTIEVRDSSVYLCPPNQNTVFDGIMVLQDETSSHSILRKNAREACCARILQRPDPISLRIDPTLLSTVNRQVEGYRGILRTLEGSVR